MTTRAQLRARINAAFPWLASSPLDWAIVEVRRIRQVAEQYNDSINRGHQGEDAAYDKWREQNA